MKNLYLLCFFATNAFLCEAQIINIPDANFKAKLLSATSASFDATGTTHTTDVDTNNDGEIQLSEAQAVTGLYVHHNYSMSTQPITSMAGIEYFTNLKSLYCRGNQIATLDVSMLSSLTLLGCANNQITQLVLPNTGALKELVANNNQLNQINLAGLNQLYYLELSSNSFATVNLSGLSALGIAYLHNNPLTVIDISTNTQLHRLYINNTLITTIDCSQTAINNLWCDNNPNLQSINVKNGIISQGDPSMLDFAFMLMNTPALESICIDAGEQQKLLETTYNESGNVQVFTGPNCTVAVPMGLEENALSSLKIYPNPASSYFTINAGEQSIERITIYNTLGQLVKTQTNTGTNIDISELSSGTFLLKIENSRGSASRKFVKQ